MKHAQPATQALLTREGRDLPALPWKRYPRPQMRRADWLCLNGKWDLSIAKAHDRVISCKIRVPFCPESLLSGVTETPAPGDALLYRRSFSVPAGWSGKRVLLHFGAAMRQCVVCVNGREFPVHENGYLPFSLDVTDALRGGENQLLVRVVNDLDPRYPWGKQSRARGGMWYTPCSGLWQTVWLEPVPGSYIRALHITTGADWAEIAADGVRDGFVDLDGRRYPLSDGSVKFSIPEPQLWSPEEPFLYDFTLCSGEDRVRSYFALRTLTTELVNGVPRLCLNGRPYFFNGLLDQGYWSDGLYTPASPECFEQDILAMK